MPKAQIAGQGNSLVEQKKKKKTTPQGVQSPGSSPVPPSWLCARIGLGFPICQTQHKDSCLLPNASVYLPNLSLSCLLPRQSVITTSARKAQEAAGHTAQPVSLCSPVRPGPRPHTGKYVEMDMQALRHDTVHTHADEHACTEIHSATYTLICAPHTESHCVHGPHTHTRTGGFL